MIWHSRSTGRMSEVLAVKANLFCFTPQRTWWQFLAPLHLKHAVLFPQFRDLALEIRLGGRLLRIAPILLDQTAQRREANTKICCNLLSRQAAG
ncbi:hypothetical protein [Ruegeria atlantica]|uniref:hypothetical protein n=1 Tax=Ruegeria atlantica TaxID=81569 RepID=UPI001581026D